MTPASDACHTYSQFSEPIPVFRAGDGKGTIHKSLPGPHSKNIHHRLPYVWYVPELEELIISQSWTKQNYT